MEIPENSAESQASDYVWFNDQIRYQITNRHP